MPGNTRSFTILKLIILLLLPAVYYLFPGMQEFISTGMNYLSTRNFDGLREFILSYGVWAPLTSIVLMTVQSTLPVVPGIIVTVANAWIFGWHYGAVYSWTGALLGAFLDFGIARWYGRPLVERFISSRYLAWIDRFFHQHGILAVFITRLTPVIPFKVVSYGAGLTAISAPEYILATGIGQTPAIVLYSILGYNLAKSFKAAIAITGLLIVSGILLYRYRTVIERKLFIKKDCE